MANVHLTLPLEVYEEAKRRAAARGMPLSYWVEEAVREKLERERARALFELLPRPVRDKLLAAAGGDELEAARLFGKILDRALEELGGPAGGGQPPPTPRQPPAPERRPAEPRPF